MSGKPDDLPELPEGPPPPLGEDLPLPDLPDPGGTIPSGAEAPPLGEDLPLPDLPQAASSGSESSQGEPVDATASVPSEPAPTGDAEVEGRSVEAKPDVNKPKGGPSESSAFVTNIARAIAGLGPYTWFLILSFSALLTATLVMVAELSGYGFHIKP